jgi:hypothetical protein
MEPTNAQPKEEPRFLFLSTLPFSFTLALRIRLQKYLMQTPIVFWGAMLAHQAMVAV